MKLLILTSACLILAACATQSAAPPIVAAVDVEASAAILEKRWQGGNPYSDDLEALQKEAREAPVQIFGQVEQHLQINPPSIWRGDTTLLDFLAIGFMLRVEGVTPGAVGPRFVPTKFDRQGKVTETRIESAQIQVGDLVRVFIRLKRDYTKLDPSERVAKNDKLWFSFDKMPPADADAFVDDGVTPRMWCDRLNARRLGRALEKP